MAFVGYRDHGDGAPQTLGFTSDVPTFLQYLEGVQASGGDDYAEDSLTGLEEALRCV